MNRIFVHSVALPMCVKGVTSPEQENGDYIIFINANLCEETQKCVLEHELAHIRENHFCDTMDVVIAEREAG